MKDWDEILRQKELRAVKAINEDIEAEGIARVLYQILQHPLLYKDRVENLSKWECESSPE